MWFASRDDNQKTEERDEKETEREEGIYLVLLSRELGLGDLLLRPLGEHVL